MLSAQDEGFGRIQRGVRAFFFSRDATRRVKSWTYRRPLWFSAIFKVKYKDRDAQTPSVFTKRTYETFRMNEPPGRP